MLSIPDDQDPLSPAFTHHEFKTIVGGIDGDEGNRAVIVLAGASHISPGMPIRPEEVREELDRILKSREFRSSRRSKDFLRCVVDAMLDGAADSLKERTIGIEVFGRPLSYAPGEDATVRVKAGEVRTRLGLYYSTNAAASVLID